jgi:hypothetical protein
MRVCTRLLIGAITSAALSHPCGAATIHVPADLPEIGSALAAAAAGDSVVIAAGTYLEHDLVLPSGVTLLGATGDPADVVIDAQRAGRCIYGAGLEAGTRIEGLTLSNGLPAWGSTPHNSWGAGLMVDGGELTVARCVFLANETAVGGGAFVTGFGSPTFVDCVFDGNSATEVAGLLLGGICDPVVRNCTFRNGDLIMVGGGVTWLGLGEALFENCLVENNTVLETGGGVEIQNAGAFAVLRGCVITGNSARYGGGGLYVGYDGRAVLESCTISGNSAGEYGGGVVVAFGAHLEATETFIRDNSAPSGPDGDVYADAAAVLTCCDIDLAAWHVAGSLIIDDEDCGVPTRPTTWSGVKALFH